MPHKFSRIGKTKLALAPDHNAFALASEKRVKDEFAKHASQFEELQIAYRKEASKLYGKYADKIAEFDYQWASEQRGATPKTLTKLVSINPLDSAAKRRKSSLKLAKEMGLDAKLVKALNLKWRAKFYDLWKDVYKGLPPELFDTATPNTDGDWVMYQPPYDGWQYGYEHWGDNFSYGTNRVLDERAGFVRNQISMDNPSASDSDLGNIRHDTQLVLLHTTRGTGPLELVIHGKVNQSDVEFYTYDEFGWSDSVTGLSHSIMAHVIHPNTDNALYAKLGELLLESDETQTRTYQMLPQFANISTTLRTTGTIAKGETVEVRFGCQSRMGAHSNDIEMSHRTNFAWHFYKVEIRTLLP
jgi:hypothetical protein